MSDRRCPPHAFATDDDGVDRCTHDDCRVAWADWARGFAMPAPRLLRQRDDAQKGK